MVNYVKGNLLDSNCDYICHQVNCQGVMGSGIAKQIRERWPEVYERYRECYEQCDNPDHQLGNIDVVKLNDDNRNVINIYSQCSYGYDGNRYTSYDAFSDTLYQIKLKVPAYATIGFPKNIGCGLGRGNWNVIITLIREILGKDYTVYIYELED